MTLENNQENVKDWKPASWLGETMNKGAPSRVEFRKLIFEEKNEKTSDTLINKFSKGELKSKEDPNFSNQQLLNLIDEETRDTVFQSKDNDDGWLQRRGLRGTNKEELKNSETILSKETQDLITSLREKQKQRQMEVCEGNSNDTTAFSFKGKFAGKRTFMDKERGGSTILGKMTA